MMNLNDFQKIPSQKGRVAIVTGANIGLGLETARYLAQKDITVVLACRNLQKAEAALLDIKNSYPTADLDILKIDLNDLDSVHTFTEQFSQKYQRLDLLINNAGLMIPPLQRTKEGFESQFGVNYVAHFYLTQLLLPLLNNTPEARIVNLGSLAHRQGKLDFDNLNAEKRYVKFEAYSLSKLACVMFTYELQRRLEKEGKSTIAVVAHPGGSMTNLGQYAPQFINNIVEKIGAPFLNSSKMGALPTVYAALGADIKGGDYTGPNGFTEIKGSKAVKVKSTKYSHRIDLAQRLWEETEKMIQETKVSQ
ncbi:oxidoreductase [Flammeovirga agarivorans]|uniref:SDR family NAD(P)-dependent oxidoreductase n=1 Tax=Flammeovirga agarivorans TaxID=2726742 RepID=A0A7X8SJ32_9BACT|nr:oxidoreductase [Flammeovirga agarivorans]NLR91154.1 SDR family NAD(P)-dependent oxidoreductase [Flammeovirga agarivorans]